ncbi:glycine cleavage system aminomethyltransferase GcvT [Methylocella tundrae]|uniref:aminomethyltransferase n=1 Tax=Methylocella tundrae TaxID=227605 RepID=A0A4V6IM92_METTU|nr:glycine cleavage system aminomethyltransferase GcvT [Methylocella tundrae]WPP05145.1 glycine cleavage system aminomethyltransferase GcvT [Methylocella tundrae]VFU07471.1 Glycine cleavage system T protein [Methylocella tundrae]
MTVHLSVAALAQTPLHDLHQALGARMVPFAGYSMPVHYAPGIIQEHLHTRGHAGLFDVSHMGQAILEGVNAATRFETLAPGDIEALRPGQMRYTQLLYGDGHILDDLMVTRLADAVGRERLFLVVNAASKAADFALIASALPDCALTILDDRALLALQGPRAAAALERLASGVSRLTFMSAAEFETRGGAFRISRSGYTGEDGFEISMSAAAAPDFAKTLLADPEVWPIGLGARDSLRLEAGLCLCGHDIDATTDPVEAGLLWSIPKRRREQGGFPGYAQIAEAIAKGPVRRRVGFLVEGKAPAREGAEIETPEGRAIGRLTSGGFAPSLGRPIAMGYVEAKAAKIGAPVHLIVRGKSAQAKIVSMPFVPHAYFRGV